MFIYLMFTCCLQSTQSEVLVVLISLIILPSVNSEWEEGSTSSQDITHEVLIGKLGLYCLGKLNVNAKSLILTDFCIF